MLTPLYQRILTPMLLCLILFQNCQSRLNTSEEEVSSAVPTEPLVHGSTTRDVLSCSSMSSPSFFSVHSSSSSGLSCPPVISAPSLSRSKQQFSDTKGLLSRVFLASSGMRVRFQVQDGVWQGWVVSNFSVDAPQCLLPVVSSTAIGPQLAWMQSQSSDTSKTRIHLIPAVSSPDNRRFVYLGRLGLLGGMPKREAREESEEVQAAKKQALTDQPHQAMLSPLVSPNIPNNTLPLVYGNHHAFGAQAWRTYFGVEVEDVPLPPNIEKLLEEKAPFLLEDETTNQRIRDNHLLTLIPSHVKFSDGRRVAFTLDKLGELILANYEGRMDAFKRNTNTKLGNNSHGYRYYSEYLPSASRTKSLSTSSYWLLLPKTILANSRGKTCSEHEKLVSDLGADYRLPRLLEAATSLLSHYAGYRERLYSQNNRKGWWTYTRCSDLDKDGNSLFIGGFEAAGLDVCYNGCSSSFSGRGAACCRKV